MAIVLDFEKPIIELEKKIDELKNFTDQEDINLTEEIDRLTSRLDKLTKEVFENLTPWQKVQISRHPDRPYTLDYIRMMTDDFIQFHGDRHFADDRALIGGVARINGKQLMIIGHQKGRDTKENLERNFGCAHPEGYRKAMRLMKIAEKFGLPVATFIDTPGAYPGIGAEERGQAEAIAYNLREMAGLRTPVIVTVIGEGGSGGALGIGLGDRVFVMQNSYYSVISPEGCAAILWRDRAKAPQAAEALKLTAPELLELGIIDDVVQEPLGGAHRHPEIAAEKIKDNLLKALDEVAGLSIEQILEQRYEKYRRMGSFSERYI